MKYVINISSTTPATLNLWQITEDINIMKFKKLIATSLATLSLLGTTVTTVNAGDKGSWIKVTAASPLYNKKGKKIYLGHGKRRALSKVRKGDVFVILGTKKIKSKKYYHIYKNGFLRVSSAKIINEINRKQKIKWPTPTWQSKHLVDTSGDIYEQIKKAYDLHGDDRSEAFKEIAFEKQMLNTKTGEIFGGLEPFESIIKTDYYNHMEAVTGKPFTDDTLH